MQDKSIQSSVPDAAAAPAVDPAPVSLTLPNDFSIEPDADEAAASPAWADDLRKLYDAVVEEPLPDSLIDLLSQLDAED